MLEESLCQIGFTRSETKVYLELLKIGSQAGSVIAKKAGFNRTTTYSILKALEKKGVISSFRNNAIKYFSANDPNCLVGYVDRKCQTFDYYRSELLSLIPKFRNICGQYNFTPPLVSYFEGAEGVKHVIYDALTAEKEYHAFLPIHKFLRIGLKDFLLEYKNCRIINKKVKLRAIVPDTKEVRAFFNAHYSNSSDMTEILYVSDMVMLKMFENQINIYNNKVSIIHLEKGEEYGVIIESKEMANMQKAIFELVWTGCRL